MKPTSTSAAAAPARAAAEPLAEFAADVLAGLSAPQKSLPCRWFYDAEGSRLFEAITATPEYYVTRAEDELLAEHADAISAAAPAGAALVELGSGSAQKSRRLAAALLRRFGQLRFALIDISPTALAASAAMLREALPGLEVVTHAAEYRAALSELPRLAPTPRLLLWLGSNVGNFDRASAATFLAELATRLGRDDRLLLGVDLRKERSLLEAAYADAAGVTAQFNLNLLARINRELGGDFALDRFEHRVTWDEAAGRISMWLVSRAAQRVTIGALQRSFRFAEGETLHTEDSWKYSPAEIDALAAAAGFAVVGRWFDPDRRFSSSLLAPLR